MCRNVRPKDEMIGGASDDWLYLAPLCFDISGVYDNASQHVSTPASQVRLQWNTLDGVGLWETCEKTDSDSCWSAIAYLDAMKEIGQVIITGSSFYICVMTRIHSGIR